MREAVLTRLALAIALIMVVPSVVVTTGLAQGLPNGCQVLPGTSLQNAVDNAPPGATIRVCPGVFAQQVVIAKSNLTLLGSQSIFDGATLDGSRFAILIRDASNVRIEGFQFRNFRNALATYDPSSAIATMGPTHNVTISNNTFADNGWTDILAMRGPTTGWTVRGNTFTGNAFAHALLQSTENARVTGNTFSGGQFGFIAAGGRDIFLEGNTYTSITKTAIVLSPDLTKAGGLTRPTVLDKSFSGTMPHAVWALGTTWATIDIGATNLPTPIDVTVGDASQTTTLLASNAVTFETPNTRQVMLSFQPGPTPAGDAPSSPPTSVLNCNINVACTVNGVTQLYQYVTQTALNPNTDPKYANDAARLQGVCAQDSCVRDEFFEGTTTHTTTHPVYPAGEVRLVEKGIRLPSESRAKTYQQRDLAGTYDVLIACRQIVGSETQGNCARGPMNITYSLSIIPVTSNTSRAYTAHESRWRMVTNSAGYVGELDRLHGPEASLFIGTTSVGGIGGDRTELIGNAWITCRIFTSLPTGGIGNPSYCNSNAVMSSPPIASLLWCTADLLDVTPAKTWDNTDHHNTRTTEQNAGGWAWSKTCTPTADAITTDWDTFLTPTDTADLGDAQATYYTATTTPSRDAAREAAERVFARAAARHLALGLPGQGMPIQDPQNATPSDYLAVQLAWNTGTKSNIDFTGATLITATGPTLSLIEPALVSHTNVTLTFAIRYQHATGTIIAKTFKVNLTTPPPTLVTPATVVTYEDDSAILINLNNPNNRDYAEAFANTSRRTHTFTVGQIDIGDDTATGLGRIAANYSSTATLGEICLREFATARSDGQVPNVVGNKIGAQPRITCGAIAAINQYNLSWSTPLVRTLKVLTGNVENPTLEFETEIDPHVSTLANATHVDLPSVLAPKPTRRAITTTSDTLTLTIPENSWTPAYLATILDAFAPTVDIIALLPDAPMPMTAQLDAVLKQAALGQGVTILAPAGVLPQAVRDWPLEDKLMTISGLAGSPHVLTIGSTDVSGVVQNASRRGPSPQFIPKPDFVAPSPTGTTSGAVLNVLPYVEATAMRGLSHPVLVRAVLGGMALPTRTWDGAPAIYYEQGLGILDISRFIALPTTTDLIEQVANATSRSNASVRVDAEEMLGIDANTLDTHSAGTVLGAVLPNRALVSAGVSATILNFTIDTPALPQHAIVNFGLINHELPATAEFAPIDYDNAIDEALDSLGELLDKTNGIDPATNDILNTIRSLAAVRAAAGQEVTLNATHYSLFDLLDHDLLYAIYADLLNASLEDLTNTSQLESDAVGTVLDRVAKWLPQPHYLAPERRGWTTTPTNLSFECEQLIPVGRLLEFAENSTLGAQLAFLLSPANSEFIKSQGRQISCLQDARDLLHSVLDDVQNVANGTLDNLGALTRDEYWNGTFNQTAVGVAFSNAMTDLGINPAQLAGRNQSAYFDRIVNALQRAIDIVDDTLQDFGYPVLNAQDPIGLRNLTTSVAATSDTTTNPFGLYVGLARMTSHNVTVYNPLTGEPLLRHNVTIPAISLLWNNPSLDFNVAYRDGTGINDTFVDLKWNPNYSQDIYQTTADTSALVNDINVSLAFDWARLAANKTEDIAGSQTQIGIIRETAGTGGLTLGLTRMLDQLDQSLNASKNQISSITNATVAGVTDDLLETLTDLLVSRPMWQANYTLENGTTSLSHIYPGIKYNLFTPYPYQFIADLNQDYATLGAGTDGLANLYPSLDLEIGKVATQQLLGLNEPAANTPYDPHDGHDRTPPSGCIGLDDCRSLPYYEVHGGTFGRYHQFGVQIDGFDLFGLLCGTIDAISTATQTLATANGCLDTLTNRATPESVVQFYETAQCLVGERTTLDNKTLATECQAWRETYEGIQNGCATGDATACFHQATWQAFHDSLGQLVETLRPLVEKPETLLIPFIHSPVRLLETQPETLGFTNTTSTSLVNQTRHANPNANLTDVQNAIGTILQNVHDFINITPTYPNARARDETITPHGILQHTTDKITGLDWHVIQPALLQTVTDAGRELDMIVDSYGNNSTSKTVIEKLSVPQVGEALNASAAAPLSDMLAYYANGWRANGSVAPVGLTLPVANEVTAGLNASQVCDAATHMEGVPASFFTACSALSYTFEKPEYRSPNLFDNAQLAVGLYDLARQYPDAQDAEAQALLTQAATLARIDPRVNVSRTTDALAIDTSQHPALGALYYSVPITQAELVSSRFQAEFYLKNTAAILITSTSDIVPASVMQFLTNLDDTADPANLSVDPTQPMSVEASVRDDLVGRVAALESMLAGLDSAVGQSLQSLRVDTIGFPIALHDKGEQIVEMDDIKKKRLPDGETRQRCLLCHSNTIAATPTGYVNYSRTFDTKPDNPADTTYHMMLVYFPSVTKDGLANVSIDQTFVVRNATFSYESFAGIKVDNASNFTSNFTLGWQPNKIEDYSLLYALPDQQLDNGNLLLDVTLNGRPINITESNIIRAPFTPRKDGGCPDSNVVGYPDDSGIHDPMFNYDGTPLVSGTNCARNTRQYLQPAHKPGSTQVEVAFPFQPKSILHALGYDIDVGLDQLNEPFTEATPVELGDTWVQCKPCLALTIPPLAKQALALAGQNITALIPFLHNGWNPAGDITAQTRVPTPVNNYLVITGAMLQSAVNATDTAYVLRIQESSTPNAPSWFPEADHIVGQRVNRTASTDYRAVVGAYNFESRITQPETDPNDEDTNTTTAQATVSRVLEVLIGNGWTGSGFALRITENRTVEARDVNRTHMLTDFWVNHTREYATESYRLGGHKTLDTGCADVPAYKQARVYFRCTGYSASGSRGYQIDSVGLNGCGDRIEELFTELSLQTMNETGDAMALPPALSGLFGTTPLAKSSPSDHANRTAEAFGVNAIRGRVDALLHCITRESEWYGESPPSQGEVDATFTAWTRVMGAVLANQTGDIADAATGFVEAIDPESFALGPNAAALTATLWPMAAMTPDGFIGAPGVSVTYGFDEWWGRLQNAWLNTTNSAETRVLREYPVLSTVGLTPSVAIGRTIAASDTAIYAFGTAPDGAIWRYTPANNTWTPMNAKFDEPMHSASVVWTGQVFYLFGGNYGGSIRNHIFKYDPTSDALTLLPATLPWVLEGTSAVWNGTHAFIFAGRTTDFNLKSTAIQFDPVTNGVTSTNNVVSPARVFTSATFDGRYAYVFGGDSGFATAHSSIVRFDTVTKTKQMMASSWSPGFVAANVWFDGQHVHMTHPQGTEIRMLDTVNDRWITKPTALPGPRGGYTAAQMLEKTYILGAQGEPILEYLSPNDEWASASYLTIPLVEGSPTTISLDLLDADDNKYRESLTVVSDVSPPQIVSGAVSFLAINSTRSAQWTVHDNLSGTSHATVKLEEVGGNVTTLFDENITESNGESTILSVGFPARVEGASATLRMTLTDRVGNMRIETMSVLYDFTAPTLSGMFVDAIAGRVVDSRLNSTVTAEDAGSGLRSVRVLHWNATHETASNETILTNPVGVVEMTHSTLPKPKGLNYTLRVEAEDYAGNRLVVDLETVTANVAPALDVLAPYYLDSSAVDWLTVVGQVMIPEQGDAPSDVSIRIRSNATNVTVFTGSSTVMGNFTDAWNATTATPGNYTVFVSANNGGTVRDYESYLQVDHSSPIQPTNVTSASTYGRLNHSASAGWFRYVWANCGSSFTVTATSQTGVPIQLYVQTGPDQPDNRTTFTHQETGTEDRQSLTISNPPSNQEYTIVTTTTALEGTPYELKVVRAGCGGGGEPPRPLIRWQLA